MNFYKRNLPHWPPLDAEFFIIFRLANSLPKFAVDSLKALKTQLESSNVKPAIIQENIFKRYEKLLDNSEDGPKWLTIPDIANLVADSIKYRDGNVYDLYCFCIMSNHIHLVFKMNDSENIFRPSFNQPTALTKVLNELQRYTAREANKILGRSGQFWHHESYDRVIRSSDELEKTIHYTLNNPVKAGLVKFWESWPFSYCKPNLKYILNTT